MPLSEREELELLELEEQEHKASQPVAPGPSEARSFIDHAGNTLMGNYGTQVVAGVTKAVAPLYDAFTGGNTELPNYAKLRDQTTGALKEQERVNPLSSMGGTATGAILQSIPLVKGLSAIGAVGKGAAAAKAGAGITEGVTSTAAQLARYKKLLGLGLVKDAALTGGIQGLVNNPGDTEGEVTPFQVGDRLKNGGIGALSGAVMTQAGNALGSVPEKIQRFANRRAIKALGATQVDVKKLFGKGGVEGVEALGQKALSDGAIGFGDTADDVLGKVQSLQDTAGQKIGATIDKVEEYLRGSNLDEEGKEMVRKALLYPQAKAGELRGKLMPGLDMAIGGKGDAAKVSGYLDELAGSGSKFAPTPGADPHLGAYSGVARTNPGTLPDEGLGLRDVWKLKRATDKNFADKDWYTEGRPAMESLKKIRGSLKDNMLDQAGAIDNASGSTNFSGELSGNNKDYGAYSDMLGLANKGYQRELGNRILSPSDMYAGGLGATAGFFGGDGDLGDRLKRAAVGGLAGVGHKVLRTRGSSAAAVTANKVAELMRNGGGALGKFTKPLQDAYLRGPEAFNSAVYMLMRRPDFKEQVQGTEIGNGQAPSSQFIDEKAAQQQFIDANK